MSIYKNMIVAVANGKKFKVDLINKSLCIDRRYVIKNREILVDDVLIELNDLELIDLNHLELNKEPWKVIEVLYEKYKHSVPQENGNRKSYFKALSVDELTDYDLAYNSSRDYCQVILEAYILLSSLQGWLTWEHEDKWFWQGKDKELIVLKQLVE